MQMARLWKKRLVKKEAWMAEKTMRRVASIR